MGNCNSCKFCGHKEHDYPCDHICSTTNEQESYEHIDIVEEPIYRIITKPVSIIKYKTETVKVIDVITKYKEITKTRKVTKYRTELCYRTISRPIIKGKYITELSARTVYQPNYYADGSGRYAVEYIPQQRYVIYNEIIYEKETYYKQIPYEDIETYTECIPYTIKEKVVKTIERPYEVYEEKPEKILSGYDKKKIITIKTRMIDKPSFCGCISSYW